VLLGKGNGAFQTRVEYEAGYGPSWVAVADLNRDGKPDLAVANESGSSAGFTVSVLLGNADGTFQAHVDYETATQPSSVVVADFNRDGKPDMALSATGFVSVLLGNGDGSFQPRVDYPVTPDSGYLAVADFNRDGAADLAVTNSSCCLGPNTVSVLLGKGDGTFLGCVAYEIGSFPYGVAVGDFNGDGRPDLVAANAADNTVSILIGNGDGTFQARVDYAAARFPLHVVITDLNGDRKPDLAVTSAYNTVSLLIGNGDGTFQPHMDLAAGYVPHAIAAGDFNGDGKPDLVSSNYNTVTVLLGNGDGTFQKHVDYLTGGGSVAVGDFNSDGAPDLATTGPLSILLNTGGTFVKLASSPNPSKLGEAVTFQASVAAGLTGQTIPSGSITLKDGSTVLATLTLDSGHARFVTSALSVGTHTITAFYSGNNRFNPNQSPPITQTVVP
jgi:hypothetical protein